MKKHFAARYLLLSYSFGFSACPSVPFLSRIVRNGRHAHAMQNKTCSSHTYAYSSPVSSRKAGYSVVKVQRKKYVSFH